MRVGNLLAKLSQSNRSLFDREQRDRSVRRRKQTPPIAIEQAARENRFSPGRRPPSLTSFHFGVYVDRPQPQLLVLVDHATRRLPVQPATKRIRFQAGIFLAIFGAFSERRRAESVTGARKPIRFQNGGGATSEGGFLGRVDKFECFWSVDGQLIGIRLFARDWCQESRIGAAIKRRSPKHRWNQLVIFKHVFVDNLKIVFDWGWLVRVENVAAFRCAG